MVIPQAISTSLPTFIESAQLKCTFPIWQRLPIVIVDWGRSKEKLEKM